MQQMRTSYIIPKRNNEQKNGCSTLHNINHKKPSGGFKMKIKQAIKELQELEKNGVKNIILAFWEADNFDREDDKDWAEDVEIVDDSFDWSATHEDLNNYIESLK